MSAKNVQLASAASSSSRLGLTSPLYLVITGSSDAAAAAAAAVERRLMHRDGDPTFTH